MFTFKLSPTGGRPTSAGAGAGVVGAVDSGDLSDEAWRAAVSYFDLGDVFPRISEIAVNYPELGDLRNSATWGFFATRRPGGGGVAPARIGAFSFAWSDGVFTFRMAKGPCEIVAQVCMIDQNGRRRPAVVAQLGKTGQIRVTDQHSVRDGPPPRSRIIGARSLLAHDN